MFSRLDNLETKQVDLRAMVGFFQPETRHKAIGHVCEYSISEDDEDHRI